jgi:4-hydroxy-tetrahydrodipicolinate reductase
MKLALIGYGKMGKAIERIALHRGHSVVAKIDPSLNTQHAALETLISQIDACIDFSHPDSVLDSVKICAKFGKPLVIGTTGWEDKKDKVEAIAKDSSLPLLFAPNFSLGVNLFLKIIKEASRLFSNFQNYDVAGLEIHHNQKGDSPSGTAIAITHEILTNFKRKQKPLYDTVNRKIEKDELQFTSLRLGHVPGTHEVFFDSLNDTITLTHTARTRDGFAEGAVIATEWLIGKKGIYTLENIIDQLGVKI